MNFSEDAPRCVVITGPTSSGKTDLSLRLAESLDTEIVSLDASQIYKEVPVLTGSPSPEQLSRARHHLVGILSPDQKVQAAAVSDQAFTIAKDIYGSGRIPVIVAGSYMYLKFFLHGYTQDARNHEEPTKDVKPDYELLRQLDPEYARMVHPNDSVRVKRALIYIQRNGRKFSETCSEHGFLGFRVRPLILSLWWARGELYSRIENRCKTMIEQGLIDEVRNVLARWGDEPVGAMKSIGFKQFSKYLRGEWTFEDAFRSFVKETKRYARQQSYYMRLEPEKRGFKIIPEVGDSRALACPAQRTVEILVGKSKILAMAFDFGELVSFVKRFDFEEPTVVNLSAKYLF